MKKNLPVIIKNTPDMYYEGFVLDFGDTLRTCLELDTPRTLVYHVSNSVKLYLSVSVSAVYTNKDGVILYYYGSFSGVSFIDGNPVNLKQTHRSDTLLQRLQKLIPRSRSY